MKKIASFLYKNVWNNYFAITATFACLDMLSLHFFNYGLVFQITLVVLAISYFSHNKPDVHDLLLIFVFLVIIYVGKYFSVPYILFRNGVEAELLPMLAFFIGKDKFHVDDEIFRKGIAAVAFCGLIGLFLYVWQPSWYVAFRLANFKNYSEARYLEMTRLSAFWEYPYWIGYGAALMFAYLFGKMMKKKSMNKKLDFFLLLFLALIVFLTQQRAAIALILISIAYITITTSNKMSVTVVRVFKISMITCTISFIGLFALNHFLDSSRLEHILSKFTALSFSGNSNFLQDRADLFYSFKNKDLSVFGDGIGMYSHVAYSMGLPAITDQGYLKLLYETGYFGFFARIILIAIALFRGIKYRKNFYLEFVFIMAILVSMFGANSLSSGQMHNIIFWLCCGRLCNTALVQKKIEGNH